MRDDCDYPANILSAHLQGDQPLTTTDKRNIMFKASIKYKIGGKQERYTWYKKKVLFS